MKKIRKKRKEPEIVEPFTGRPISEETDEFLRMVNFGGLEDIKPGQKAFVTAIGDDGKPMMLFDHPFVVEKAEGGKIALAEHKPLEEDPEKRKALAIEITDAVIKNVRRQIGQSIEEALSEKSLMELLAAKEALAKGEEPKVKRKRGCLYLDVGRQKFKI